MIRVLFAICVFLGHISGPCGQRYDNMTRLLSDVLSGYNTEVRPLQELSGTLEVNVSVNLYNILEVDTIHGVITIVMTHVCTWYDERITWNSAEYGGISSIKLQQQHVWTPELMSTSPVEFTRVGYKWVKLDYQSNGLATWLPGNVYRIACPMNIKHWPFDEQQCDLTYYIYGHLDNEVLIQPIHLETGYLQKNGEWELYNTSVGKLHRFGQTEMVITLHIRRRVVFYRDTLIIPLFFLVSLGGFVFLLPSESGERVSYCITILLSLTVFLDVISDEIPKLSNPVPMLCQFLLAGIIIGSLDTVLVVLNLLLYHRSKSVPINKLYRFIVKLARCQNRRRTKRVENVKQNQDDMPDKSNKDELMQKHKMFVGEVAVPDTEDNRTNEKDLAGNLFTSHKDAAFETTWQDVSIAFDRILFILNIVGTLLLSPIYLLLIKQKL